MAETKHVLICEFRQESNTFNPKISQLSDFYVGSIPEGPEGYALRKSQACAVHGAIDALEEAGMVVIPTVFLSAPSGGRVADSVLDVFFKKLDRYLEAADKVDAAYVSLHGATCMVSHDDGCGFLLTQLRKRLGSIPIAASFDLHANITDTILTNADIICGYQTYPHTDFYESGYRAASLCVQHLQGSVMHMASVPIPALLPPAGYNSLEGPFGALITSGNEMILSGMLLDYTVFPVQPWLDIPNICSRVVTIAKDPQVAKFCSAQLAQELLEHRNEYYPPLMPVDQIIDIAQANTTGKVVVLADAADSPNGGAVGDSPLVAMRLLERGSKLRAGMFIVDPESVKKAFETGIGNSADFRIGAAFTPGMPGPLTAEGTVCSLHDGIFRNEGPAGRGIENSIGKSAVVRFGNIHILLCNNGASTGDPQIFRHFGIEPTLCDLIVVKANTSFLRPYSQFTDLIYYGDTPGAGASNLKLLQWNNLPHSLYPFDLPEDYTLPQPKLW